MTKITILDGYVTNPGDLSWQAIENLGELTVYDRTFDDLVFERAKEAEILVVNKRKLDRELLLKLDKLKCICTLATGYNNIDISTAKERGIVVSNAVGYSSPSVAQHVFALILELLNKVHLHNKNVQKNGWADSIDWSYWESPIIELSGKTMGIFGLGKIGQEVARIANAFGMNVIANRRNPSKNSPEYIELVSVEKLFRTSDILSLHAPLNNETAYIINTQNLNKMKPGAILINTGRGGLVKEVDLKHALLNGTIVGAGLDVLSKEPPERDHILLNIPNCIITPHHAWASKASRKRLIQAVADNIEAFLRGKPQNVVFT